MNIADQARRLATDHQRLVAGVLLLAGCLYLVRFVDRGWVPLDEGMVGQAAERVLKGQLPHADYEEPYPGALSYFYAAVFRIGGIDVVHLRWTMFAGAIAGLAVLYAILRRILSPITASVTTLVSLAWTYPNYFSSLPSWWVLLCALVSLWAVIRHVETGRTRVRRRGWPERWRCLHAQTDRPLPAAAPRHVAHGVSTTERERRAQGAADWTFAARCAISLASIVLVLSVTRSGLGSGELLYLVSPIAASCVAFLLWDRWSEGPPALNWRAALIAAASAAIPALILLLPHMVAGQVPAFVNGVFVLPQQRLQYTMLGMRPASQIVAAGAALMWICWSPPTLSAREVRFINVVRWLLGVGLVFLALRSRLVYALIWEGVRGTAALVPWIAAWLLIRGQVRDAHSRTFLFASSAIAAWLSLSQFPFAAPIYFCYVAPLALVAGVLAVRQAIPVRRLSQGPTIAIVLLFAFSP